MPTPLEYWPAADKAQIFRYLQSEALLAAHPKILCTGLPAVGGASARAWFARLRRSTESAQGVALEQALSAPDFFRFALVRNPYHRVFSAWQARLLLRDPAYAERYGAFDFFTRPVDSGQALALAFEAFLEHLADWEAPLYWDAQWTPQTALLRPELIAYAGLFRIEEPGRLQAAPAAGARRTRSAG